MTIFRSEGTLIGIVSLALVPWLLWRLRRGLAQGWLPLGRGEVRRDARPGAFRTLFALYGVGALAMTWIGIDLLVGIAL